MSLENEFAGKLVRTRKLSGGDLANQPRLVLGRTRRFTEIQWEMLGCTEVILPIKKLNSHNALL